MTSRLLSAALLALLLAAPAGAADEVAEARAQYDQGARLYRAGKYLEAIDAFEAAYRLKPHGAIHFNVAQCREKLGQWPAALRSYQDYLRELPDARDRVAVRAAIGKLEQRLAAAGVQALLIYSDPPGASVQIDGKEWGRTPFHTALPPGSYRVVLALEGFQPKSLDAALEPGTSRVVDVVLRSRPIEPAPPGAAPPDAGAAGAAVPGAAAALGTSAAAGPRPDAAAGSTLLSQVPMAGGAKPPDLTPRPPPEPLVPAPTPEPPAARPRISTWVAAGVSVAALAAGAWFGLEAQRQQDALRDGAIHEDADALAKDATQKAKTANVLYGISGVAAAAGVTLFFVEGTF